jgi:exonuclease SbcC
VFPDDDQCLEYIELDSIDLGLPDSLLELPPLPAPAEDMAALALPQLCVPLPPLGADNKRTWVSSPQRRAALALPPARLRSLPAGGCTCWAPPPQRRPLTPALAPAPAPLAQEDAFSKGADGDNGARVTRAAASRSTHGHVSLAELAAAHDTAAALRTRLTATRRDLAAARATPVMEQAGRQVMSWALQQAEAARGAGAAAAARAEAAELRVVRLESHVAARVAAAARAEELILELREQLQEAHGGDVQAVLQAADDAIHRADTEAARADAEEARADEATAAFHEARERADREEGRADRIKRRMREAVRAEYKAEAATLAAQAELRRVRADLARLQAAAGIA